MNPFRDDITQVRLVCGREENTESVVERLERWGAKAAEPLRIPRA